MHARSFLIAWLLASPAGVTFSPPAEQARPQSAAAPKPASDRIHSLSKETPVQRTLKAGERHRFQINFRQNQFVVIGVEQIGIDVVMSLVRQNGTTLIEIDGPDGLQSVEQLPWVTQQSGRYFLDVRSRNSSAAPGRYELRVVIERKATAQDAAVVAAAADYSHALLLGAPRTTEADRGLIEKLEKAAAVLHEAGDYAREAHVCRALAEEHRRVRDYQKAFEWYEREARVRHDAGDLRGEGIVLNNIGVTHSRQGDSKKALDYLRSSAAAPSNLWKSPRRGEHA